MSVRPVRWLDGWTLVNNGPFPGATRCRAGGCDYYPENRAEDLRQHFQTSPHRFQLVKNLRNGGIGCFLGLMEWQG